jgi:predicted transcriptional regulator of viral defense system
MEKSKQGNTNYLSISQNEAFLIALVKTQSLTVFGVKELQSLSTWSPNRLHNTLFSLTKKNILTRIKRNTYTLTEQLYENIFEIATAVVIPSYISFWTALSYYGFTEQQIQTIQLISTRQTQPLKLDSHTVQITTFQPREFFGYKRIDKFVIAEKEKALIDSLFQLEKCGGLQEYVKCLKNAWADLNKKTFLTYLHTFHNRTLFSRMGFLMEHLKLKHGLMLEKLEQNKSISPVKLNPQKPRKGSYNKRWNTIVNDTVILEDIR